MKITNIQISIPSVKALSPGYIETELKKQNIDALRWAIVGVKDGLYTLNISCIEK